MVSTMPVDQCICCCSLHVAPATKGAVNLNHTIPDLLDMGCAYGHQPALHRWSSHGWQTCTYNDFRVAAEEFALGLVAHGVIDSEGERGRIGLLLESDVDWALADMGGLLAGMVTVPLDRGQPMETIRWIVADAELQVLVVSTWKILKPVYDILPSLALVVMVENSTPPPWLTDGRKVVTIKQLRDDGRQHYSSDAVQTLRRKLHPNDLATIVYAADANGGVRGAMLSHKSLTGNIWAAFSSMPELTPGTPEVALSFLPLHHIFARAFLYGHFGFGHHIYFSSPKRVLRHLGAVQPTIFITVPRLLEKVYERINSLRHQSFGWKRQWLTWGWWLAHRYTPKSEQLFWSRVQRWMLSHGVFGAVHRAFGGKIRYLLCGGAALRPEIMTFFNGIGIPVKQGYGLTETSSVLSYTRDRWFGSGTVGAPIPGVAMRLAADGEVLVKSPYVMDGYFHDPAATDAVIDEDGWFHTGDLGEFSGDGLLILRGCKKGLFKLSTGKYVAPGPIEEQLEQSPLVQQALLMGPGQKFCGVLLVPSPDAFTAVLSLDGDELGQAEFQEDTIFRAQYQALIDRINTQLPHWSQIKRFTLIESRADANGGRQQLYQIYGREIEQLYRDGQPEPQVQPKNVAHERRRLGIFDRRKQQTNIA